MGFEQPSFGKVPSDGEKKLNQNTKNGWIFENGIWKKPIKEESIESTEEDKKENSEKNIKENDKRRKELEKDYKKLEKKEYKEPEDLEKIKKIEKEHQELSDQIKKIEESKKIEENQKELIEEDNKKIIKSEKKEKSLKIEQEIIENYYEELEKIKAIPESTDGQKKQKTEKYFELIDEWKDQGHKDNYKGIQKIISEVDKLEPKAWFFNLARNQTINKVALAMASNYKEWDLENKKKIKVIKKIVNKQRGGFWENKDQTLQKVAKLLASQGTPYKDNIDLIIKDIQNPNVKTEALTNILDIEKNSIEQKKQLFKKIKEEIKEEDKIDAKSLENTASILGMDELFKNPENISKMFAESSELMKNPEIQEKWQELNKVIKKVTEEKNKKSTTPDSVKKAKEFIKKPGSTLGTMLGMTGWIVLLFLTLFMLTEFKGVDYLVNQSSGGKKK